MVPLGAVAERPRRQPARIACRATTCTPRPRSTAPPLPGYSTGQAHRRRWSSSPREMLPRRHRLRVDRAGLPAEAGRQHRRCYVFALVGRVRVPGAGGAVRELVAAAGGDPDRADVPALLRSPACCCRGMDINIFTQIGFVVLVGLACQERDPDRRVRQAAPRSRATSRVEAAVEAARTAAAADPDDLVRLHPRRGAAGDRRPAPAPRCARRWAPPCSPACSA